MVWMFDSHIHLSDPTYENDLTHIIKGMEKMRLKACCVSMNFANSKKTLELAKQSELILPFVGIHPENANDNLNEIINLIHENIQNISGIGEIGLDPTYIHSEVDKKNQLQVFESLLSVSEKFQKPISIHSRKSLDEVLEIMSSYKTKKALLHWFDGSKKQLRKSMDMGFFVSYGPVTIYADDKKTLLSKTDEDKILVETDGPVKFGKCFEMKSAQISFIPSVIFCSSTVLGKSYDEMVSVLEKNTRNYLGI